MRLIVSLPLLFTSLLLLLPFAARSDQNDPRLEDLFATLQSNRDQNEMMETEAEIWEMPIWRTLPCRNPRAFCY